MKEYANPTGASVMTRRNRTGRCFDHVIDGPTLMDMNRERKSFCVETLIPKGVCILGGAPKVGKSWLALDLCIKVAKGEPLWDLPTRKGTDAKHLKQLMQQRADDLEQHGVKYLNWRSNGQRLMKIWYEPPQSDDGDCQNGVCESVVPVGTDSPETVMPNVSKTVDTIEVEVHPDAVTDQSENSDDRVCDGDAVDTADGTDEMDSGWVDEIRDALGVTLPVGQPDDNGRGERNGHPLDMVKDDTKEVSSK